METCQAIILKIIPYSDTQRIVHLYSKERGYLSMISPAFVFKRKDNPLHLLQITEITYFENPKSDLHKLKSATPLINLPNLYFDIFKMNILLLWGEVLSLILRNEGKNEALFEYLLRSVEYLNAAEGDAGNFNLFFLYRLAAPLGFRIDAATWQPGAVFNARDGKFYLPTETAAAISGPNTARIIHRLCTCPVEEVKAIPLNRAARNILIDIILAFYRIHLNIDFNVKSIRVLRESAPSARAQSWRYTPCLHLSASLAPPASDAHSSAHPTAPAHCIPPMPSPGSAPAPAYPPCPMSRPTRHPRHKCPC